MIAFFSLSTLSADLGMAGYIIRKFVFGLFSAFVSRCVALVVDTVVRGLYGYLYC